MDSIMMSGKKAAYPAAFLLCGLLLAVGTWYDLPIAQALYRPMHPAALFFTCFELLLYFGAFVFLLGALCRQLLTNAQSRQKKLLPALICGYLGLSTSVIGSMSLCSASCFGALMAHHFTFWNYLLIGGAGFYPLFFLGLLVNGRRYDRSAVKHLITLFVLMTIAFYSPVLCKNTFDRPRFRITQMGYDDIDFVPWYKISEHAVLLMERFGLVSDDFSSFFSGHAVMAMCNFAVLPAFALVIPALRGKEKHLSVLALLLLPCILLSRMVLGGHYLSDIAVGVLVGSVLLCVFRYAEKKCRKKQNPDTNKIGEII